MAGKKRGGKFNINKLSVLERLQSLDFDPLDELVSIAKTTKDEGIRLGATKELASYAYPKLKSVEIEKNVNLHLAKQAEDYSKLTPQQQVELMEQEIKRLKDVTPKEIKE